MIATAHSFDLAVPPARVRLAAQLGVEQTRELLAKVRHARELKHPERREHLLGLTETPAVIDGAIDGIQAERDARRLGEEHSRAGLPYVTWFGDDFLQAAYADGYGSGMDV